MLPCLLPLFVSCLFTLVKYCADPFDYLPAFGCLDSSKNTCSFRLFCPRKYTKKQPQKKIFFT